MSVAARALLLGLLTALAVASAIYVWAPVPQERRAACVCP